MQNGKPSETPVPPTGGWTEDHYKRCQCGTPLVVQDITLERETGNIAIAKTHLCNKCNRIIKRWLIPGRYVDSLSGKEYIECPAERLKITKGMIAYAMEKYKGIYCFTIEELKEGEVQITEKSNPRFNSDRFVEPVSEEPLF